MVINIMWTHESFDEEQKPVKAHFVIEHEEWDRLEYNINTSKSQFLRDCVRRINGTEAELDKLYKTMVLKRNELRLLELEIEDLKARIDELEKANIKRHIK